MQIPRAEVILSKARSINVQSIQVHHRLKWHHCGRSIATRKILNYYAAKRMRNLDNASSRTALHTEAGARKGLGRTVQKGSEESLKPH